jgi:hypothetical protein
MEEKPKAVTNVSIEELTQEVESLREEVARLKKAANDVASLSKKRKAESED